MALIESETLSSTSELAAEAASVAQATAPGRRRRKIRVGYWMSVTWLAVLIFGALTAPIWAKDPTIGGEYILTPPLTHGTLLGTDELGRDMLSRVLYGARTSLTVVGLSILCVLFVGLTLGLLAGYFRGLLETVITGLGDIFLAFPGLVFLLVVHAVLGSSVQMLVIGFLFIGSPMFMRIARANTLAVAEREYVRAAVGLGAKNTRVITRDILPNIWGPVSAYTLTMCSFFFIAEGGLAYLGLSVPPPASSWGRMIAAGQQVMDRQAHLLIVPACMLLFTVMSINVIGNFGRDRSESLRRLR